MKGITVTQFLVALFTVATVIGGAWWVSRSGSWRGEAEAQKQRGDRLEKEVEDLKERVRLLEEHNKALSDLVTAAPQIRELQHTLDQASSKDDARHDENTGHLSRIEGALGRIERAVLPRATTEEGH